MKIIINNSSMIPIYEQIMEQIKTQILDGVLAENDSLPSVRMLAAELKISALTVKKAYDILEEQGFVVTIHGKGTFVARTDKDLAIETRKRMIEEDFATNIARARNIGMSEEEIKAMIDILLED